MKKICLIITYLLVSTTVLSQKIYDVDISKNKLFGLDEYSQFILSPRGNAYCTVLRGQFGGIPYFLQFLPNNRFYLKTYGGGPRKELFSKYSKHSIFEGSGKVKFDNDGAYQLIFDDELNLKSKKKKYPNKIMKIEKIRDRQDSCVSVKFYKINSYKGDTTAILNTYVFFHNKKIGGLNRDKLHNKLNYRYINSFFCGDSLFFNREMFAHFGGITCGLNTSRLWDKSYEESNPTAEIKKPGDYKITYMTTPEAKILTKGKAYLFPTYGNKHIQLIFKNRIFDTNPRNNEFEEVEDIIDREENSNRPCSPLSVSKP